MKKRPLLNESSECIENIPAQKKQKNNTIPPNLPVSNCILNKNLTVKKTNSKFRVPLSNISVEPLLMPRPSEEHQVKQNDLINC